MKIIKLTLFTLLYVSPYSFSNDRQKYELNRPIGIAIYTTLLVTTSVCIGSIFNAITTQTQPKPNIKKIKPYETK